jgi:hypothetical protein
VWLVSAAKRRWRLGFDRKSICAGRQEVSVGDRVNATVKYASSCGVIGMFFLYTGQFKKKITLSHVYNESLQSRDIQQLLGKLSKFVCNWRGKVFRAATARGDPVAKWRLQNKRRSGYRTPLPWRWQPETLSHVNYKQTLRVFLTIVVYRVIVGSLVTSLQTCESVNFFFNCPVYFVGIRTNTHLNCAVACHSTIYLSTSVRSSYQEQMEMDTEICRLWYSKESV